MPNISCNLGALSPEQMRREQELLTEFQSSRTHPRPIDNGYRFEVPADPKALARLGEFLALERRCCPFLQFDLAIHSGAGPVTLDVYGEDPSVGDFIRNTFLK